MISIATAAAVVLSATPAAAPVMLDARCDEPAWRGARSVEIGEGVSLKAIHDRDYVYLCLNMPPESLGTMDMFLAQEGQALVNLHVSAQVGERTRGPAGWPDWTWGNQRDWYGPPVAFSGMKREADGGRSVDFRPSMARELQLSKARFGKGPWRARFEVRALGPDNKGAATFPAGSRDDNPMGWAELRLSG